ncbi:4-coumarate--CoA ligase-like 5 [Mycoemilia scoparia]|uniref:4-coumarate--CoA ligase-like 5 n=1 Tax=Mycoemilia scoparia TaxID=417184 RepID=A0A9W8DXC4_9FUNG|nr:4-coumarate--CoA ligase-like 5 [Mycoemilia scoparia]
MWFRSRGTIARPAPPKDISSFVFDTLDENLSGKQWSKTAIISGSTGRSLSFDQIYTKSSQLASGLQNRLGIRRGDMVFGIFDSQINCTILFHATMMIGAVYCMSVPNISEREIARRLSLIQPKVVVTTGCFYYKIMSAFSLVQEWKTGYSPRIYLAEPDVDSYTPSILSLLTNESYQRVRITSHEDAKATAIVAFTSGSTGTSKAVEISHKALVALAHLENQGVSENGIEAAQQATVLIAVPTCIAFGLYLFAIRSIIVGGTSIAAFRSPLERSFENISKYQVTDIIMSPKNIIEIRENWNTVFSKYDISSVKSLCCSGFMIPFESSKFIEKYLGIRAINAYGTTETLGIVKLGTTTAEGSVGVPFPEKNVKIKGINGKELKVGEVGLIWIYSETNMNGYFKNPKLTAMVTDNEGFVNTNDVGMFDIEGKLHLLGRFNEMIHHNGQIISPRGTEKIICSHPGVKEASVIGVYNPKFETEVAFAYIVPSLGSGRPDDISEIISWVNSHIQDKKKQLNAGAAYISEIPKNCACVPNVSEMKDMFYKNSGILPP